VGIVAHSGFVPMFWLLGQPRLAQFNVLSVACWVAAAVLNRRGRSTPAMWLLTAEVVAHAALAVSILGWASGFQYYLIPLIPFVMFNDRLGSTSVTLTALGVFAIFLVLSVFAPSGEPLTNIARAQAYANIAIPFLALGLVSFYFRLASTSAEKRMEAIASGDSLTGLLNRRKMDERLEEERVRFERSNKPFSVIMADVDHFKKINDTFGHPAGDRVLRAIATIFGEGLRGQDAASRWGGEEFLLLLPETDVTAAQDVANRLREAAEGKLKQLAGLSQNVTLTFGVATFTGTSTIEACIKTADDAMYEGKRAGRNRVVG
jgi:diguanylate cyclase (GGDEF)-like protein